MNAIEQHIEKLWKLNNCELGDMTDISECMTALNIQYGVNYKQVGELDEDEAAFCTDYFKSDVEETFCDRINTQGINYNTFRNLCLLYLDFSKMYKQNIAQCVAERKPSKLFNAIANLVRQENETKFGLIHK